MSAELLCPYTNCRKSVVPVGEVFCESGEYDDVRGCYEAEWSAPVYHCENGHAFALNVPFSEKSE